jgi:predicted ATPase
MKVDRVLFRGLKALQQRDDRFTNATGDGPASSACLRGLNGSGKTTYLEAIASLWKLFRRWSQRGTHVKPGTHDPINLSDLVAIRVVDVPGPNSSMWLVYGEQEVWESIPDRSDDAVIGVLSTGKRGNHRNLLEREHPIYRFWDDNATKLEQVGERGSGIQIPNMVMIGAEDRFIQPLRDEDLFELAPEAHFRFLARYQASDKKSGHIENSMAALLAVAPDKFAEIAKKLNQVLPRLQLLNRADLKTRRPLVKLVTSGAEVTLEHLSAGERAALIALFMVVRWMARGGVVLIDEPELHQHLSLMRANLGLLENYVVNEMGGQLIVASHAPEVWDHFRVRRPMIDLDYPSDEVLQ